MAFDVCLSVVALLCGLATAVGGVYLRRARTGGGGPAGVLLGAAGVTTAWTVAVAVLAWIGGPAGATVPVVGAVGVVAVTTLLLIGALRLPAVAATPALRLRRAVDGALLTSALIVIGWIAGAPVDTIPPDRVPGRAALVAIGIALFAALAVIAFATVAVLQSPGRRKMVGILMSGLVAVVVGGAVVVVVISLGGGSAAVSAAAGAREALLVAAATIASGIAAVAYATAPAHGMWVPHPATPRAGWWLPGGTVLVALAMILVRAETVGVLDRISVTAGVVTAAVLAVRQMLALGDAGRYLGQLREDEAHLRDLAHLDPLTGIGNRRLLMRTLYEEAVGGPACVLAVLDLDGFKNVNDLRGHDVGDAVLVEVGRRLREHLRPGDVAVRLGGDEFAALMWASQAVADEITERLRVALARPYETATGPVYLTASLGVAGCASAGDVPTLMRNADLALRFARQQGKGHKQRYDAAYDEWIGRRTTIEHELRGAVDAGELSLVFQPIVALPDGRPVGAEALLRWSNALLGTVGPDEFIPIAEESGLIAGLDRWVLDAACEQLATWLAAGHDLWVSVNVSVRELHLDGYVEEVAATLCRHGVPAHRLVLEVTEHSAAIDLDDLVGRLSALRAAGVRIALDDFGAGYSSLGQLRHLPVDILKIDRALVGDPARGGASRAAAPLVDIVVRLGRRLRLLVIAEGVGEEAERKVIERAGCTLGQGNLFAGPMPADSVEALLTAKV